MLPITIKSSKYAQKRIQKPAISGQNREYFSHCRDVSIPDPIGDQFLDQQTVFV